MLNRIQRIAVIGDSYGTPMVLRQMDPSSIVCLIAACIRPYDLQRMMQLGEKLGVPCVVQPRFNSNEYNDFVARVAALEPDLFISNSFSMVVRPQVLRIACGNAINTHAAILPRHRGPNPIQWALISGDSETGVTMHYMSETIDAGDIIASRRTEIREEDTWVTVRDRLTLLTEELLREQLPLVLSGANTMRSQDAAMSTTNSRLDPQSPRIDFTSMDDREVFNLIRAQVRPLGGAYVETDDGRVHFRDFVPLVQIPNLRRRYGRL